jgi:iron complex outermembrane receptor protein
MALLARAIRNALPPLLFLLPAAGGAQMLLAQAPNLADLSLEELGNLRVTTAALRPERYSDTPASIYVITNEEIHRSGATNLPEALRLAPNLEVAQVSATTYAISARGFQNVITNKLLVLLDGRTLYTTVLSGVLWDAQDVLLDDVERIEVVSGPGAALYGANAFGGVINIISKSSQATEGALVTAGGSDIERNVNARFGGKLGTTGSYRLYGMHIGRDNLRPPQAHVADDMDKNQVGFRTDFGAADNAFTVQGDAYEARITGNGAADVKLNGANLFGRWATTLAGGSHVATQAYYDHTWRNDPATFKDRVDTYDLQLQDDLPAYGAHRISLGAGYRYAIDDATPTPITRFIPEDRRLHWASAVGQDQIALEDDLTLTVGAKVQTDVYVPAVFLPDVRIAWKPMDEHLVWASASRVARTPGRVDRDFFFPGNPPFIIQGGPNFKSETGNSFDIGYRAQPRSWLTVSLTGFYTQLDNLRGGVPAPGGVFIGNTVEGRTTGLEAWALLQVTERWRLMAGLLELHQDLKGKNGDGQLGAVAGLGNDPRHTVKARSSYRFGDSVDFDVDWRYVSSLSYLTTVPAYAATDLRLAWHVNRRLELSIRGTNVFDPRHVEFDEHGFPAEIPRATYAQVRWSY